MESKRQWGGETNSSLLQKFSFTHQLRTHPQSNLNAAKLTLSTIIKENTTWVINTVQQLDKHKYVIGLKAELHHHYEDVEMGEIPRTATQHNNTAAPTAAESGAPHQHGQQQPRQNGK